MSWQVMTNTNPAELRRRLQASGPIGFIMSVYNTLQELGRPYLYSAAVPDWMEANATIEPETFAAAFNEHHPDGEAPTEFTRTPHAIIHQYRMYPANRRYSGTPDSPSGARRQKTPGATYYSDRVLPQPGEDYFDANNKTPGFQPALLDTDQRPPLWDKLSDVPDLIRDHVDEDTICHVAPWEYDVFVDFVIVTPNLFFLEQIHSDMMHILHTFHSRWVTGQSNLQGWFYSSVSGAPPDIAKDLRGDYAVRTITWRLKQGVSYAFPVQQMKQIYIGLYGQSPVD